MGESLMSDLQPGEQSSMEQLVLISPHPASLPDIRSPENTGTHRPDTTLRLPSYLTTGGVVTDQNH